MNILPRDLSASVQFRPAPPTAEQALASLGSKPAAGIEKITVVDACPPGELVEICAWCPDKPETVARVVARGQRPSGGICPACKARLCSEVIFEAGERRAAPDSARETAPGEPSRLVEFSCRLGGRAS